jgi:hypothetical protein
MVRMSAVMGIVLFLSACQPDKPETPSSPTALQKLTIGSSRTWRLQALAIAGTTEPIPPCLSDDRWTFRSDGTTTLQNPNPCLSGEPSPTVSGSFRFTNNDRFLVLTLNGLTETRELIQLSDNLLVWSYMGDDGRLHEETWIP